MSLCLCRCSLWANSAESRVEHSSATETFSGQAFEGYGFKHQLKSGLQFELEPRRKGDASHRTPTGWVIWLGDPANPSVNYCAVLTPPFHGPNPLVVSAYELLSDEEARLQNTPGRIRVFRCVTDQVSYTRADDILSGLIGPGASRDMSSYERTRQLYEAYQKKGLKGRVDVVDVHLSTSDPASEQYIRFNVELTPGPDTNRYVELRLSVHRSSANPSTEVTAHLDFIGHAGLSPPEVTVNGSWQIAIEPEVTDRDRPAWQGGFFIEVRDEAGHAVQFSDGRSSRRFPMTELQPGAYRVYRKITDGGIQSVDLPLSQWFRLKTGRYRLKVHYAIYEASTEWTGPITSNEVEFAVGQ